MQQTRAPVGVGARAPGLCAFFWRDSSSLQTQARASDSYTPDTPRLAASLRTRSCTDAFSSLVRKRLELLSRSACISTFFRSHQFFVSLFFKWAACNLLGGAWIMLKRAFILASSSLLIRTTSLPTLCALSHLRTAGTGTSRWCCASHWWPWCSRTCRS